MVRLKSRYLVARLAFKDGKLFSSSSSSTGAALTLLEPASEAALLPPLRAALLSTSGELGAAASGPGGGLSVRAFDPSSGVAVIRCPRSCVASLRLAMATALPAIAHRSLRGGGAATLRVCGSAGSARRAAARFATRRPLPSPSPPSLILGTKKSEKMRAAVLRVREDALKRIAAFDA
jgi:RNase P/RNase MRP subunit POP5